MRRNSLELRVGPVVLAFLGFFVVGCFLLLAAGCQEQAAKPQQQIITQKEEPKVEKTAPARSKAETPKVVSQTKEAPVAKGPLPKIMFEKVVHDFGEIGPGTRPTCDFTFKNAGDSLLKITSIITPCGCTVAKLEKKEYKPGESGTIHVTYTAGQRAGSSRKYVHVNSNDPAKPKTSLSVKSRVVAVVSFTPQRLNLLLEQEDADVPKITLTSISGDKFSITGIRSTADSVTADFDSSIESAKFVLEPKVDVEKLKKNIYGTVVVSINHPKLKSITIPYSALSRFKISPPMLYVLNTEPGKPVKRDLWVLNNYGETFEIESVVSKEGLIKVTSEQKISKGYQYKVEITPPSVVGNTRAFSDVLYVQIKGGEKLDIRCTGTYSPKVFQGQK